MFKLPVLRDTVFDMALADWARNDVSYLVDRLPCILLSQTATRAIFHELGEDAFKSLVKKCCLLKSRTLRWRENSGTLVSFLSEKLGWLPTALTDLHFDHLSLKSQNSHRFSDCTFGSLSVEDGAGSIDLVDCVVETLDVPDRQVFRRLVCGRDTVIHSAVAPGMPFAEDWLSTSRAISAVGGRVEAPPEAPAAQRRQEVAKVLRQLRGSSSHFIVVNEGDYSIADDKSLRWANKLGELWSSIAKALIKSSLVNERRISASGDAKLRLSMQADPKQIAQANKDSTGPMGDFWRLVDPD